MPERSVFMTTKMRLSLIACFSILLLFPAATAWAKETAYGWTVGSAHDGRGSILYTSNSGQTWTYQGGGPDRERRSVGRLRRQRTHRLCRGRFRQRLRDHLPNDGRGGGVDQAGHAGRCSRCLSRQGSRLRKSEGLGGRYGYDPPDQRRRTDLEEHLSRRIRRDAVTGRHDDRRRPRLGDRR